MHLDVNDLRDFYCRGTLGRAAQRVIRGELRALWPDVRGHAVAGFGFASPLLRPFLGEARRVFALMPGPQGALPWPMALPTVSVLCEETLWPLPTGFIDRLVVLHGLECSEQPDALIEECRRVLGPGGRAVFIVPNRAGLWSRSEATPFGQGRPYSLGQLDALLRRHRFQTERTLSALYQPPSSHRFWRRAGGMLETAGRHLPVLAAGGVVIAEVVKQQPARIGGGLADAVRRPIRALEGRPQGRPLPVGAPRAPIG